MNARRVGWLLVAGLVVIGFAIWVSSLRHLERATLAGDLVLPGLEHGVNTVTEVRLHKADDIHTTLQKGASGWLVAERGWPAEVSKVRKLLLDLGALNVVEEKTRLSANYPALGVEDLSTPKASGTQIEAVSPARTWALIVGKASGAKSGYVRVANAPQSFLAAPLLTVDAAPKSWLVTALLDLPAERLREIEERPAEGAAYSATKQKTDDAHFTVKPVPKGRELSGPGAADSLAAALSALTLEDVAKAPAADPKAPRAFFRTFDGLELEVAGRKDGNRALVSLSARATTPAANEEAQHLKTRLDGWEFEIPDYKYAAIFTPLTELLKPLPEPPAKAAKPAKSAKPPQPAS
ncbi:MAG TPA: DUF4340 domain-containing protein [Steroidobacteraceae bacterium]|jgi:hypothetical protein|nr:DUF4340 domain-containing protein [Steroidobacteraceae bacterium]